MNDPHVTVLRYRLVTDDNMILSSPPREEWSFEGVDIVAEDGVISVRPTRHWASIDEAREALAPFMRAWELDQGLFYGRRRVWFEFVDGDVVDRDPPGPGEPQTIELLGIGPSSKVFPVAVTQTLPYHPNPPNDLIVTPDTETLWQRYLGYKEGREPLPAMAYFCLTVVERDRGRQAAAKRLGISLVVLRTLGKLTAQAGDAATARKAPQDGSPYRPLSSQERRWVEDVVKALIRRVAYLTIPSETAQPTTVLTMNDFIFLKSPGAP